MESKIHIHVFSYIKSLKINDFCFHLLIIRFCIYIQSRSTCKEAAILQQPTTVAQNMDLFRFFRFYTDITAGIKKM